VECHNEGLPLLILSLIQKYFATLKLVRAGEITDIPLDATSDRIFEIPALSKEDQQKDWIFVPLKFTPEQIKQNLKHVKLLLF
jgi:hypothetical protein